MNEDADRVVTSLLLGECDLEAARRSIAALLTQATHESRPRLERIAAALEARAQAAHRVTNLVAGIVLNVDFAYELAATSTAAATATDLPDLRTALGHARHSSHQLVAQAAALVK